MVRTMRLLAALLALGVIATACGGGGEDVDCELGNEITADFEALGNATDVEDFKAIQTKIDEFDAPEEIEDDVATVSNALDTVVEELESGQPDPAAIEAAGEGVNEAGERIEAYLEDNC